MNTTSSPIEEKDLIKDPKRNRFLEEIHHHAEDAGDDSIIGSSQTLQESFNTYARPRRNRRLLLTFAVMTMAFATVTLVVHPELYDNNMGSTLVDKYPFLGIFIFPIGFIFYAPVMFMVLQPLYLAMTLTGVDGMSPFGENLFELYWQIAPLVAAGFWGGLTYILSSIYDSRRSRNTKRTA